MSTHKSSSSALIITTLISSILMTIALGLSRGFLKNLETSRQIRDGQSAYWAAESGIEYGLLRLRQNPKLELAETEVDLKDSRRARVAINQTTDVFELPILPKDRLLTINLSNNDDDTHLADTINFTFEWSSKNCQAIEIKIISQSGKELENNYASAASFCQGGTLRGIAVSDRPKVLTIFPIGDDLSNVAISSTYSSGATRKIGEKNIQISSIGFYGKAKRKLIALIDTTQESGVAPSLIDFTIFAEERVE